MTREPQDDEGFLSRWSRRKRQAASADAVAESDAATEAPAGRAGGESRSEQHRPNDSARDENHRLGTPDAAEEDEEARVNREMAEAIDVESLTDQSDISAFLKRGVPKALKNAALARIWRSNPVFAVLDGLNDYDEDYQAVAAVKGGVESAWQIGKGYADKAQSVAREMEEISARLASERAAANASGEAERMASSDLDGRASSELPVYQTAGSAGSSVQTGQAVREGKEEGTRERQGHDRPESEPAEEDVVSKIGIRRRMAFGLDDA